MRYWHDAALFPTAAEAQPALSELSPHANAFPEQGASVASSGGSNGVATIVAMATVRPAWVYVPHFPVDAVGIRERSMCHDSIVPTEKRAVDADGALSHGESKFVTLRQRQPAPAA